MIQSSKQDFIRFLNNYCDPLKRICRVFANEDIENNKLKNEIINQLWKSYDIFMNDPEQIKWIYRIGINTALFYNPVINNYRSPLYDTLFKNKGQDIIKSREPGLIYSYINRQSVFNKAMILLFLENRSTNEIAWITGVSENNVHARISDIQKNIERILEPD